MEREKEVNLGTCISHTHTHTHTYTHTHTHMHAGMHTHKHTPIHIQKEVSIFSNCSVSNKNYFKNICTYFIYVLDFKKDKQIG